MAAGRQIENRFSAISRRHICRSTGNHMPLDANRSRSQSCNFPNSRWRTAAILKIVYLHISAMTYPISITFGMHVDADFLSEAGCLTKIEILQIQDGGRTPS